MNANDLVYRATGKTTRIIDELVQNLYKHYKEWINVHDHWWPGQNDKNHKMSCESIVKKLLIRMEHEHPNDKVEVDKLSSIIKVRLAKCPILDEKARGIKIS